MTKKEKVNRCILYIFNRHNDSVKRTELDLSQDTIDRIICNQVVPRSLIKGKLFFRSGRFATKEELLAFMCTSYGKKHVQEVKISSIDRYIQ